MTRIDRQTNGTGRRTDRQEVGHIVRHKHSQRGTKSSSKKWTEIDENVSDVEIASTLITSCGGTSKETVRRSTFV